MATINASNPTLLDLMKMKDPSGRMVALVEPLAMRAPILEDATVIEGNTDTGNVYASRTALPAVAWRKINEGVSASKGKTDQVSDSCGMLYGRCVVDAALVEKFGGGAELRAREAAAQLTAFRNELETGVVYHSTKSAPEKFMGIMPRLDSTTGTAGNQILLHDGTASGSDQASILLVAWSPETVALITPKGSTAGFRSKDLGGIQLVDDGSGNSKSFRAYVEEFNWDIGLMVKDYRYICRIGNIDTGNLSTTGSALIVSMIRAIEEKIQDTKTGRLVFYVNRKIASYLRLQAMDSTKNSTLTIEQIGGKPVLMFSGIPVRATDALLNTEATLT